MEQSWKRYLEFVTKQTSILVVDDEYVIGMVFQKMQETHNCCIDLVTNAIDGIRRLQEKDFDIVFLDMKLECGQNGLEVLEFINKQVRKPRTVIMSGSINLHDVMEQANALGVLSFMRKPVAFTQVFLANIFDHLNVRQLSAMPREMMDDINGPAST